MKTYAKVEWSPEDVLTLREDMSMEEAEEFLVANQKHLRDRLVELGWEVMESLLSCEGK